MRLRKEAEFPILEFSREQADAVPQNDIDRHVAKVFGRNRLNPAEKERIKLEVNFSLSRLVAHRLVKRSGDGFTRITLDGSTIMKAALDAMDAELERKEAKARRK